MPSLYEEKLLSGETYTVARGMTLTSNGDTASVYIGNPSDSGKQLVFDIQEVVTDNDSDGVYYRSPDVSGGMTAEPQNDLVGDGAESVAEVRFDASYSNPRSTTTFPFTSGGGPAATVLSERGPIALKQGESVAVEVSANADGVGVLFMLVFFETSKTTDR